MSQTTPTSKRVRRVRSSAAHTPQPGLEQHGKVVARELHDSVAQTLASMLLELETFRLEQYGRASVLKQVDLLEKSTRQALSDLRRLLTELRAEPAGEEDLVKLVKHGMLARQTHRRRIEFGLSVAADWPERIPSATARELHHIIAEAIENGIRHSDAKRIEVSLGMSLGSNLAVLTVHDDGHDLPKPEDGNAQSGLGILGMRERAILLGGEVQLVPGRGGRGTTVRITVPLAVLGRPTRRP